MIVQGFGCIDNQVHQDLADLGPVHFYGWQIIGKFVHQLGLLGDREFEEVSDVSDESSEIGGFDDKDAFS